MAVAPVRCVAFHDQAQEIPCQAEFLERSVFYEGYSKRF
jgi:hypothetical protein